MAKKNLTSFMDDPFAYWSVRRAVQLRGKEIVIIFLYFNSKVCKKLPKKVPMGKKSQKG